jgi:hypothetical protein
MLAAYFDDSNTHSDSPFMVWGGLVGEVEALTRLEERWRALLREPPFRDSKPLSALHMTDLANCKGEFEAVSFQSVSICDISSVKLSMRRRLRLSQRP